MKKITLIVLIFFPVIIIFSCKKKQAIAVEDSTNARTTAINRTDSISALTFSVNGVSMLPIDTVIKDIVSYSYNWSGGNTNSRWNIFIKFSGNTVPIFTSYAIVNYSVLKDTLLPARCNLSLYINNNGALANTGVVTISPGSPNKVSFHNIVVSATASNIATTYTVSGTLPFY